MTYLNYISKRYKLFKFSLVIRNRKIKFKLNKNDEIWKIKVIKEIIDNINFYKKT